MLLLAEHCTSAVAVVLRLDPTLMPAGFSLRCPYHAFLFGVACAASSVAVALLLSRRQRHTVQRFGVEGRFTDVASFADLVFMSGQVATGDTVEEQTTRVLQDVDSALEKAGSDKSRILELTVWLSDMKDYDAMNSVYDRWIDPGTVNLFSLALIDKLLTSAQSTPLAEHASRHLWLPLSIE